MHTVYDFVTLGIFSGLVVLFLQRSMDEKSHDPWVPYLVSAVLCAVTNYLGNQGNDIVAVLLVLANIAFIIIVIKPFKLPWLR